ncbi:MAG: hypothetical protein J0I10_20450 [Verrucomicrobia bacterium]|nr:hypothetical protein [Verrucomicrobiota bacterium]
MKFLLSLFATFASLSLLSAQMPELVQLPLGDSLVERRLAFAESQLGVSRTDWKLTLPKEYSAKLVFRRTGSDKPIKEVSLEPGTTNAIFFATVPQDSHLQVSFGTNNEETGTLISRPRQLTAKFGFPDGAKDFRLFELSVSDPQENETMWCEVSFQKH